MKKFLFLSTGLLFSISSFTIVSAINLPAASTDKEEPCRDCFRKNGAPIISIEKVTLAQESRLFEDYFNDRGTKVVANDNLEGAYDGIQGSISNVMSGSNFIPKQRMEYYQNLDVWNVYRCNGWCLKIQELISMQDGYIAKFLVSPIMSSPDGAAISIDRYFIEYYKFSNGNFQYLGGEGSSDSTDFVFVN